MIKPEWNLETVNEEHLQRQIAENRKKIDQCLLELRELNSKQTVVQYDKDMK